MKSACNDKDGGTHHFACDCREKSFKKLVKHMTHIQKLVDKQAEDDGLWFLAQTAPEAYLQAALRTLHAAIEDLDGGKA